MKSTAYKPLTATPHRQNETYQEILPELPGIAKYIRCFWGSTQPYIKREEHCTESIVVPDTCADIIYNIDHTDNTITGGFCGINDAAFRSSDDRKCGHLISTFAIRLYAWGAYPFAEDSLRGTANEFYDVQSRFAWLDRTLRHQLFERHTLTERARIAEEIFRRRLSSAGVTAEAGCTSPTGLPANSRRRENGVVDCAVTQILLYEGAVSTAELAHECFVSSRQLERLFHEYIGMTPKKLCNLVRYQCLWNEIMHNPGFQTADAVYRYGYTDQSHLLREFKRYHAMDIHQARALAYDHVGNIQYFHDGRRYNLQ